MCDVLANEFGLQVVQFSEYRVPILGCPYSVRHPAKKWRRKENAHEWKRENLFLVSSHSWRHRTCPCLKRQLFFTVKNNRADGRKSFETRPTVSSNKFWRSLRSRCDVEDTCLKFQNKNLWHAGRKDHFGSMPFLWRAFSPLVSFGFCRHPSCPCNESVKLHYSAFFHLFYPFLCGPVYRVKFFY